MYSSFVYCKMEEVLSTSGAGMEGDVGTVYKSMDCPLCIEIESLHLQRRNISAYMFREPIKVIFCMWQCELLIAVHCMI